MEEDRFKQQMRAFDQWKKRKREDLQLIVGVRLVTVDAVECLAYPTDREALPEREIASAGDLDALATWRRETGFVPLADGDQG